MEREYKILLVEDERMLAEILGDTLNDKHFDVDLAYNGKEALQMLSERCYDVIVTDVMMPHLDGFSFVKQIRHNGNTVPVLFLTARTATEDVVKGFDIGGNDYLRKPFAIDELIARIRALAQRHEGIGTTGKSSPSKYGYIYDSATYRLGKYSFSPKECTLIELPAKQASGEKMDCLGSSTSCMNRRTIKLAARESAVLQELCKNMNMVVESSQLLMRHWGNDNFFSLRSLNVYITRLRNHFKDEPAVKIISIRGVGYRLEVQI